MGKQGYNFSRFRAAVLQASAEAAGGEKVLRRTKGPIKEIDPDFESGLTSEEARTLSCLIFVSALKVLHNRKEANPANGSEIGEIVRGLYESFGKFCPPEILPALPGPTDVTDAEWETVWNRLSDPRIGLHWANQSALGTVYQLFSGPLRKESQERLQSANKTMTLRRLISFTQLYTPDWVVDFLVENTLVSQWSGQTAGAGFEYLLKGMDTASGHDASALTLIDPACGSGHFLLRAFDIFLRLYELEGWSRQDATAAILKHNLFGVDIDPVALWVAAFSLMLKCMALGTVNDGTVLNLAHVQEKQNGNSAHALLGTLSPVWSHRSTHPLSSKYHCVVTNPPYIGRKLLDRQLKNALKAHYPDCHHDLCAAFLRRGIELLLPTGRLGLIGQASLMFLPTYGDLRKHILTDTKLISVVEAGPGVFPLQGGEKVNSALYIVESPGKDDETASPNRLEPRALFIDLVAHEDKQRRLLELIGHGRVSEADGAYARSASSFFGHRKNALNYKCPPIVLEIIQSCERLGKIADLRQGLATSDNERFVRHRSEVDPNQLGVRWFPYVKGAGSERWWAPVEYVVDWQDNGAAIKEAVAQAYPYLNGKTEWVVKNEQYYFREGLTFSFVNSRGLAVRRLPPGCIFDVGGSAIFAEVKDLAFLLGYLNSSFILAAAKLLNPTINFQVGDLKQLPILEFAEPDRAEIAEAAKRCCELKQELYEFNGSSETRQSSAARRELSELEARIDELVTGNLFDRNRLNRTDRTALTDWIEAQSSQRRRLPRSKRSP